MRYSSDKISCGAGVRVYVKHSQRSEQALLSLKMFFKAQLVKSLNLQPRFMGRKIAEMIHESLRKDVEGKLIKDVGFVVLVVSISDDWMGKGVVENTTGGAIFNVTYEAIVFRPFLNEVLDAIVTSVNNFGFSCSVGGMLDIFVHRDNFPSGNPEDPSRFVDNAWISDDDSVHLRKDCGVRVRLVSMKFMNSNITGIGSIKDDFCGVLFESQTTVV